MRSWLLASVVPLVLAGVASGASLAPEPAGAPEPVRPEERRLDVEFLATELPKLHIRPFDHVSRAAWERSAHQLGVEAEAATPIDFYLRLSQLVAMLGDSHTRVGRAPGVAFGGYPLAVGMFKEGPALVAVDKAHAELLGARLTKVGETAFDDAVPRIATLFPYENRAMLVTGVCQMVTQAEPLVFLQLIEKAEDAAFTFVDEAGKEHVLQFDPVRAGGHRPQIATLPTAPREEWAVSYRRDRDYWCTPIAEKKAVYIKYDACRDDPERPFAGFVELVGKAIEDANAERVLIDLRSNGGGDSRVIAPLTKLIASQGQFKVRGSVAVLIGRRTFSSAQLNALELQRECGAVLVGLPTGQKPNAFGEVRTFKLPSSGIEIQYSTKEFRTAPPGTDPESTMPDVEVEPSVKDAMAGRDPTLERALALPLEPSPAAGSDKAP